ncbi:MAG: hypothetical protein ACOYEL_06865 [Saccharofermentanales bacterium]|jgi:hypothetical protein
MRSVLSTLRLTGNEFRKWIGNKRIILVLLMLLTVTHFFVSPLRDYCSAVGYRTSPYIFSHLVSEGYVVSMFLFIAVILYCNAPFIDNLSLYELSRAGKRKWFISKLLYVYISAFIFVLIIFFLTIIVVFRYIAWIGDWGKVISTLSLTTAGYANNLAYFSSHIVSNYNPLQATALSLLMLWLQTATIGMIVFSGNLVYQGNRFLGILVAAAYSFAPFIFGFWDEPYMITFFPAMWNIPELLKPYVPGVMVTYNAAFWLLLLIIVILSFVSWLMFRQRDVHVYPEL